jgi:biopolymer transport protein ExbD
MKIGKGTAGSKVEPEITPASLPDIAFLLLIFFIATTIFETERGIPLILPPLGGSTVKMNRKNVMVINSDAMNRIYIDDEPASVDDIARKVETRIKENEKLVISIESHPESQYQTMIDILDEVKKAKATRISVKLFTG